jgi:uncharacterized protein YecE (DUF72 family)
VAIRVGTSGWTDKTLLESRAFYPPGARSAEDRLRYYASVFPIVEVDATYYAPPSERNAQLWAERTPPGFLFNVKAYSLFTRHPTRIEGFWGDLREALPPALSAKRVFYVDDLPDDLVLEAFHRFRQALRPLAQAGKLGVVLLQFPPWVTAGRRGEALIAGCVRRLGGLRAAVEFRHKSWLDWYRDRTLAFLRDHDLPLVCVDMPQGFPSSVPPLALATSPALAMVRFHGRNTETWNAKSETAAERFRYHYRREELEEWVPRIRHLSEKAAETHVLMNNCYRDWAVQNARDLMEILGVPAPASERTGTVRPAPTRAR